MIMMTEEGFTKIVNVFIFWTSTKENKLKLHRLLMQLNCIRAGILESDVCCPGKRDYREFHHADDQYSFLSK